MSANWDWITLDRAHAAVNYFGKRFANRFGGYSDARHEAMAYLADNPALVGDDSTGAGLIFLRMVKLARKAFGDTDVPDEPPLPPEAETVSIDAVEHASLIAGVYEPQYVARLAHHCYTLEYAESYRDPFADAPRPEVSRSGSHDPSHGNSVWAAIADIRTAYCRDGESSSNKAGLTLEEERAFLCVYGLDMTPELTREYGINPDCAEPALFKICNRMNSKEPNDVQTDR